MTTFVYNDGGRKAAGFKGEARDCVTRAISIATEKPYKEVYDALNKMAGKSVARTGVLRKVYEAYLLTLGWKWVPTMLVGQGCKVHLNASELPEGKIIARLSRHIVAVIDGVAYDTSDPSRGGTRCVYGYFQKKA